MNQTLIGFPSDAAPIGDETPPGPTLTADQLAAQSLMANSGAKHVCLVGGSRSGKTSLLVRAIIIRALRAPNSRHLIARFRMNALRSSIWLDTYPKVMRLWFPWVKSTPYRQLGYEQFENGSEIWMAGLDEKDRIEKILGLEFATIFANEVSQIGYGEILTLRTRLAQPGTGLDLRGYYDLNPTSTQHWSNVEFGDKRSPVDRTTLADPENYVRAFLNPEGNAENLDPTYLQSLRNMPKTYRERFYEGRYLVDVEGALWTSDILEMQREDAIASDGARNNFQRIAIGVDPSGAQSKDDVKSDEIGIVVVGVRPTGGKDNKTQSVVLADYTMRGSPTEWGRAVAAAYKRWQADVVVAEANYGGAMVQSTIQAVGPSINVKLVNASRGKVVRAEPVSALYGEDRVRHAGRFTALEDQMCLFSHSGYKGDRSPDRADAAIWAITELMLGEISTYTLANL